MIQSKNNDQSNWSAFKKSQIRYRRKGDDPNRSNDISEMVDFSNSSKKDNRIIPIHIPQQEQQTHHEKQQNDDSNNHCTSPLRNSCSESSLYHGPMYGLKGFPGFIYAPQALSKRLQDIIAFSSVSKYCESPNATNIDLNPPKASEELNSDQERMWDLWKEEFGFTNNINEQQERKKLYHTLDYNQHLEHEEPTKKKQRQQQTKKHGKQTKNNTNKKKYKTFKKLSWATMGYHYDWTARCYHDGAKSPMPSLLKNLSSLFARTALFLESSNNNNDNISSSSSSSSRHTHKSLPSTSIPPFTPSACIVNFYDTKSSMGGHRDDLELAKDKPLVSISVGLPAVFLMGGKTKEDEPVIPMLIRPGDVMIMGGESRLNYHGMARLLPSSVVLPNISTLDHPRVNDRISRAGSDFEVDISSFGLKQQQKDDIDKQKDENNKTGDVVDGMQIENNNKSNETNDNKKNIESSNGKKEEEVVESPQSVQNAASSTGNCGEETTSSSVFISENDQEALAHFLSSHRININIRQVYPDPR